MIMFITIEWSYVVVNYDIILYIYSAYNFIIADF